MAFCLVCQNRDNPIEYYYSTPTYETAIEGQLRQLSNNIGR